ncbi:hypothetical protein, partial [Isoptericola rhizosphaerae]|uniref:hypothetical protein n=1 Tax=Isoptericola rhizosphaerae TaxID=3377837 RepID=UPI00383B834D
KVQNLALTIKHTVEFSNNRRTPSKTETTAPTRPGQPFNLTRSPGPVQTALAIRSKPASRGEVSRSWLVAHEAIHDLR